MNHIITVNHRGFRIELRSVGINRWVYSLYFGSRHIDSLNNAVSFSAALYVAKRVADGQIVESLQSIA